MKTVTTRIPEDDEEVLVQMEEQMGADRSEVLRRLVRRGLEEWRREEALERLENHEITLRKAAEMAGVDYVEMVTLSAERGIDSGYSLEDLERDVDRV